MIDLSKIQYRVAVIDENGGQHLITDLIKNLGWEENENEIAVRASFVAANDSASGYLSEIIKPGCPVLIFASDRAAPEEEAARWYVEAWDLVEKSGGYDLKCSGYDELYKLQKSQDNRYYPSGSGTKAAVQSIFDDWEIPQGSYEGPDVSHGKMVYNNRYLSDILLELLDDAVKKGGKKCIIRASKGRISIIPRGSNRIVYVFQDANTQAFNQSISTADLVTRVKVLGKEDKDGKRSVEATLDGMTQYGIRQRIYTRGSDESLSDAQAAAQAILDKEGTIREKMSVESPDVPFIRKGDLVYIISQTASACYYVLSIRHNADTYSMQMDLEIAEQTAAGEDDKEEKREYNAGDIVNFHGGIHYVSSYPDAKGYTARAGQAKITKKDGSGKAHPWHLIHTDSGSNVYGWVDDGTFD